VTSGEGEGFISPLRRQITVRLLRFESSRAHHYFSSDERATASRREGQAQKGREKTKSPSSALEADGSPARQSYKRASPMNNQTVIELARSLGFRDHNSSRNIPQNDRCPNCNEVPQVWKSGSGWHSTCRCEMITASTEHSVRLTQNSLSFLRR
jgi:hypothetical protein